MQFIEKVKHLADKAKMFAKKYVPKGRMPILVGLIIVALVFCFKYFHTISLYIICGILGVIILVWGRSFIRKIKNCFYPTVPPNKIHVIYGGKKGMRVKEGGKSYIFVPILYEMKDLTCADMDVHCTAGVKKDVAENETGEDALVSKDGLLIGVSATFRFRLNINVTNPEEMRRVIITYIDKDEDTIKDGLKSHFRSALRTVISKFLYVDLFTEKEKLREEVKEEFSKLVDELGITVVAVSISRTLDREGIMPQIAEKTKAMKIAEARIAACTAEYQQFCAEEDLKVQKAQKSAETQELITREEVRQQLAIQNGEIDVMQGQKAVLTEQAEVARQNAYIKNVIPAESEGQAALIRNDADCKAMTNKANVVDNFGPNAMSRYAIDKAAEMVASSTTPDTLIVGGTDMENGVMPAASAIAAAMNVVNSISSKKS